MQRSGSRAVIIGAGPAGLTAAYELLTRTAIHPVVLERSESMGGLSRTVNYRGNRIDIGGHRFFSKSSRVMDWWARMLPMLVRERRSRIYHGRKFFDYPLKFSLDTVGKLGLIRVIRIGLSYFGSVLSPIRPEKSLEDFFINRFGRELYRTFFQDYTEKVWGVPCSRIDAGWGAQRVKGLSIRKTLIHAVKSIFSGRGPDNVHQKGTETSLIERFLYPEFGPGQMWEETARKVREQGGDVRTNAEVVRVLHRDGRITAIEALDRNSGRKVIHEGDVFFSTMPIKHLLRAMDPPPPQDIAAIGEGLVYRDFMIVGLLVKDLLIHDEDGRGAQLIRDNWIYIQEPDVKLGRLQIFNNWSPSLVADPSKVWLGLEYFCDEGDALWRLPDQEMIELGKAELVKIGILRCNDAEDGTVLRVGQTYPAYFGTYERFGEIRQYLDGFENLYPLGRNGMHRYNNQDHSMLTAMVAVDNIVAGTADKSNIWGVNTEQDYHEEETQEA